jgi:Fic family protein
VRPPFRGWQWPYRTGDFKKALAQTLGPPTLIALAYTIERNRNDYYAALERNNKDLEITDWMIYFEDGS